MYSNKELPAHSSLYVPIMAILLLSWFVIGLIIWNRLQKKARLPPKPSHYGSIAIHQGAITHERQGQIAREERTGRMPYLTDEHVDLAAGALQDFEDVRGHAPTAERLLQELAKADKEIKRIVKKADEEVLKEELISKLKAKGLQTDD